jgi:SRSO17 transposase
MSLSLEARFEQYCDTVVNALMHADREQPARWYIKGLMLPGERKSVEPMAARVCSRRRYARRISRCITWWLTRLGVTRRCCRR